jgi:hypothetical protein
MLSHHLPLQVALGGLPVRGVLLQVRHRRLGLGLGRERCCGWHICGGISAAHRENGRAARGQEQVVADAQPFLGQSKDSATRAVQGPCRCACHGRGFNNLSGRAVQHVHPRHLHRENGRAARGQELVADPRAVLLTFEYSIFE